MPKNGRAAYDGLGRRLYKAFGDERTEYFWDGDRLAAEVGPTGALRLYVYPGPEALVPLLFIDYDSVEADPASGRIYYPVGNQLGVPLHIEDGEGKVVWWAEHVEPYGTVTVRPGASIAYALRFPGHYFDEETGLHYNRFRYYSPRLGRYLQSDPAGQSGGINLYAYPANPLVDVDVLGLMDNLNSTSSSTTIGAGGPEHPHNPVATGLTEPLQQQTHDHIWMLSPDVLNNNQTLVTDLTTRGWHVVQLPNKPDEDTTFWETMEQAKSGATVVTQVHGDENGPLLWGGTEGKNLSEDQIDRLGKKIKDKELKFNLIACNTGVAKDAKSFATKLKAKGCIICRPRGICDTDRPER